MRSIVSLLLVATCAVACSSKPKAQEPAPLAKTDAPAPAAETKVKEVAAVVTPGGSTLSCAKAKDARTLVVRAKEKGCELAYTKNGQEAVVASGKAGNGHCEATREKIATKLKSAGYTCQ